MSVCLQQSLRALPPLCPPRDSQQAKGRSLRLEPTMRMLSKERQVTVPIATLLTSQDTCLHFLLKCDGGCRTWPATQDQWEGALKTLTADIPSPAQQGHHATSSGFEPSSGWSRCPPAKPLILVSVQKYLLPYSISRCNSPVRSWHELGIVCLLGMCCVSPSSHPQPREQGLKEILDCKMTSRA